MRLSWRHHSRDVELCERFDVAALARFVRARIEDEAAAFGRYAESGDPGELPPRRGVAAALSPDQYARELRDRIKTDRAVMGIVEKHIRNDAVDSNDLRILMYQADQHRRHPDWRREWNPMRYL